MNIVDPKSLADTIDNLNEAFFFGRTIPESERLDAAEWIAGRQIVPRKYAGMFAPARSEYDDGFRLFTGERIKSNAAIGHILGEEACRALILLDIKSDEIRAILEQATKGMLHALENYGRPYGMYCCGTCTPALWRHLAVGGLDNQEKRLKAGMKILKTYRDGKGRWKRFPFYWTLLALSEIDMPAAKEEIRYTASVLERIVKRPAKDDKYARRRKALAENVLALN